MSEITDTQLTIRKEEAERMGRLSTICELPETGSLAKGLQNYHGITLFDTLKLMSLVLTKQAAKLVEHIEKIDAELATRTRTEFNPMDLNITLVRAMTPAEEHMLREDRSRLLMVLTTQHNQKIKEVSLELQAAKLGKGDGKKQRKPGFTPLEIEAGE